MRLRSRLPMCLGMVGLGTLAALVFEYTVDDAFVVARYARNLAEGNGWAMNPGDVSDGLTGPLWIAPGLLSTVLGISPVVGAKWIGGTCGVLSVGVALHALSRRVDRHAGWWAAAVFVSALPLAVWAVSGLETGAAALAVSGLVASLIRTTTPQRELVAVLCTWCLAALRPELLGFALVVSFAISRRALVGASLCALSIFAVRYLVFASWLPLSFYAKQGDASEGLPYVLRATLLMTGIGGAVLCALAAREGRRGARPLAAALFAHLLAVTLAGGDWMPGFRLLAPVIPAYAVLFAWGARYTARGRNRNVARMGLAFAGIGLLVPVFNLAALMPEVQQSSDARRAAAEPLARRLAELGGPVALVDVGFLGYASGVEVVDLGGITDPVVARSEGGHLDKRISLAYLDERSPAVIVLHSAIQPDVQGTRLVGFRGFPVEQRLARSRWLQGRYEVADVVRYTDDYHYVLLVRMDD